MAMVVSRRRARNWAAGVDGGTRGGHRGGLAAARCYYAETPWPPPTGEPPLDVRSSKDSNTQQIGIS
jgi:hypothetical protein